MEFDENEVYNGFDFITDRFSKGILAFDDTIDTKHKYYQWRTNARKTLKGLLGFNDMESACSLETTEEQDCIYNDVKYKKIRCVLGTMERLKMPFYMLVPQNPNGSALLALHGHGSNGKEGLVSIDGGGVDRFNYTYALDLTAMGYTVFVPDMLGAGERCIYKGINQFRSPLSCADINNAALSFGMSLQGIIVFETLLLIDAIDKQYGFKNIGCVGFSGGGHTALWVSAFDDRISFTVVSGFFHSFKDVVFSSNWCGCNFVPGLWKYANICDIAALSADKPFFVEYADDDNLNGKRGAAGTVEMIERANTAFKIFDNEIETKMNHGGHRWYGSCYEWLKNIKNKEGDI